MVLPTGAIIRGINDAGLNLFLHHEAGEENAVLSPYSIGSGLHSLLLGADGSTYLQLSKLLQPTEAPHIELEKISAGLVKTTENTILRISNKIFHQHDTILATQFQKVSTEYLNAGLMAVDFKDPQLNQLITDINSQVEKETNGKISNLLSEGIITAETRMVLVNILYFKGTWKHKFKKYRTTDREFYIGTNRHVLVPTMQLEQQLRYAESDDFQSAALEFLDTDIEMILYKPKHNLKTLLPKLLNHEAVDNAYEKMSYQSVELNLPKFLVESKYSLKGALMALGLDHLFDDSVADFSRMTASGARELTVSEVLHNTFLSVDENGCEAASATASVMRLTRSAPIGPEPIKLHLNVPFLYMLRDKKSGVVLFVGTQTTFSGAVIDHTEL
ncbi:hypothetical protein ACHWQZ_G007630 [Mnemiopsis leidyi]